MEQNPMIVQNKLRAIAADIRAGGPGSVQPKNGQGVGKSDRIRSSNGMMNRPRIPVNLVVSITPHIRLRPMARGHVSRWPAFQSRYIVPNIASEKTTSFFISGA